MKAPDERKTDEENPDEDGAASGGAAEDGDPGETDSGEGSSEDKDSEGSARSGSGMEPPHKDVSSEEGGRIPLTQTDNLHTPAGGETVHDDEYTGSGYANSATDIDRLLESMAEKAVTKQNV